MHKSAPMKKLLLLSVLVISTQSFAQSWAAPGATWYYDFQYFQLTGFERIQNMGDTMIGAYQYNKLQIYRQWYDMANQQTGNYTLPQYEFTREDSGVVYYYRDSADYVLYDFNAQAGDTWVLRNEFSGTPCDTSSVVVDSTAITVINGDTLRVMRTSPLNWNGITFQYPRIVEKIGSFANLFPYTMCVTDIPQGYGLRCYTDSSGWTYHNPAFSSSCDDMMGIHENTSQSALTVIPDLQSRVLKLRGSAIQNGSVIQIYNSNGQLIAQQASETVNAIEVNLPINSSGIYFVTVTKGQSRVSVPFYAGE